MRKAKSELRLEKATTTGHCRLCKVNFRKEELSKVLTSSIITRFLSHLRKRGVFLFKDTIVIR